MLLGGPANVEMLAICRMLTMMATVEYQLKLCCFLGLGIIFDLKLRLLASNDVGKRAPGLIKRLRGDVT